MLIKVRVTPNSKIDLVVKKSADTFLVKTRAKARNNQANQEILRLLANYLKLSPQKIKIIKGGRQSNKILNVL